MQNDNDFNGNITHSNMVAYSKMAESAGIDLELLRDIDTTIEVLNKKSRGLKPLIDAGSVIIDALNSCESHVSNQAPSLDESGEISNTLEIAGDLTRRLISDYINKRATIDQDDAVPDEHKEFLHDGYEEFLQTLASLEQIISLLSDLLIGYELARESRDANPTFSDSTSLRYHIMQ
jgi:hypothetical protein